MNQWTCVLHSMYIRWALLHVFFHCWDFYHFTSFFKSICDIMQKHSIIFCFQCDWAADVISNALPSSPDVQNNSVCTIELFKQNSERFHNIQRRQFVDQPWKCSVLNAYMETLNNLLPVRYQVERKMIAYQNNKLSIWWFDNYH